jgi:ATP-dependent helicase YprA (DUF1998 family)
MNIDDIFYGVIEYHEKKGITYTEREKEEMKEKFDSLMETLKEVIAEEYKNRTGEIKDIKPIIEKVIGKNIENINKWVHSILCPDVLDMYKAWTETINIAGKLIDEVIQEAKE